MPFGQQNLAKLYNIDILTIPKHAVYGIFTNIGLICILNIGIYGQIIIYHQPRFP